MMLACREFRISNGELEGVGTTRLDVGTSVGSIETNLLLTFSDNAVDWLLASGQTCTYSIIEHSRIAHSGSPTRNQKLDTLSSHHPADHVDREADNAEDIYSRSVHGKDMLSTGGVQREILFRPVCESRDFLGLVIYAKCLVHQSTSTSNVGCRSKSQKSPLRIYPPVVWPVDLLDKPVVDVAERLVIAIDEKIMIA